MRRYRPILLAVAAVGIAVLAFARYADAVFSFLFLDDFVILRSQLTESATTAFTQLSGAKLYRPLTQQAYFALLWRTFGLDATGYHAVQVAAFAFNCALALGILFLLTGSLVRAACGAFVYMLAPAHAAAVYWLAAFTMVGTTTVVFLAAIWWLLARGRVRIAGGAALQIVGLLCSEHALTLPVILFAIAVLGPRREAWRRAVLSLGPSLVIVAGYLAVRLASAPLPTGSYALRLGVVEWGANLGRFAVATIHLGSFAPAAESIALWLGLLILASLAATWAAVRSGAEWARLPALGLTVFVVALLPVLPLTAHFYAYYAGIAALGSAIALIGLGDLVPTWSAFQALAIAVVIGSADLATCRAGNGDPTVREIRAGADEAAELVRSMEATQRLVGPERRLVVARSPITDAVIDAGQAQRIFLVAPTRVSVIGGKTQTDEGTLPPMPLVRADPSTPPFWWAERFEWIRSAAFSLHSAYLRLRPDCP